MKKNKKALIPIAIITAIVLLSVIAIIIWGLPKTDVSGPHGGVVQFDNEIVASAPTLTNPDDPGSLENQLFGIPAYMFDSTTGRSFDFSIKDNRDGYVLKLTEGVKYKDFKYDFLTDPDPSHAGYADPIAITVKPGETSLQVEGDYNKPNDIFVFGGLNETKNVITGIDEATLVYVSYRGSSDWTLCGINTSMTRDDVIKQLGTPTQENDVKEGHSMAYYIASNNHVYVITVIINPETNTVYQVEWLMDNLPVFANHIVPDDAYDWIDDVIGDGHDHDHETETQSTQPTE